MVVEARGKFNVAQQAFARSVSVDTTQAYTAADTVKSAADAAYAAAANPATVLALLDALEEAEQIEDERDGLAFAPGNDCDSCFLSPLHCGGKAAYGHGADSDACAQARLKWAQKQK